MNVYGFDFYWLSFRPSNLLLLGLTVQLFIVSDTYSLIPSALQQSISVRPDMGSIYRRVVPSDGPDIHDLMSPQTFREEFLDVVSSPSIDCEVDVESLSELNVRREVDQMVSPQLPVWLVDRCEALGFVYPTQACLIASCFINKLSSQH